MIQNNFQIRTNVSVSDVATVLGANSCDVGTLCKHVNINRWAIYKPEISNKMFLTKADRIANKCGLAPKTCPTLKSHIYPICENSDTRSKNVTELQQWTYNRPTGGSSSPYRLGDFLDLDSNGKPTTNGYDHDALPCDTGWGNLTLDLSNIKNVCSGTFTTRGSGTSFSFTNTSNSWVLTNNVSFRFDETSSSQMNSANSKYMPLSYATGNGNITSSEYWRICILVWIPYTLSGAKANYWIMFTGKKVLRPISSSNSIGDMLPNLASNQYGAELLKYNRETKGVTNFSCAAVLARNVTSTTVSMDGTKQCLTFENSANAIVYSMPSGTGTFDLIVSNNQDHAIDSTDRNKFTNDVQIKYKIGVKNGVTWYIGFMATGVNGNYQTIYDVLLLTDSTSSCSATITGTLTYVSNPTGASGAGTNQTYTVSKSMTASSAKAVKAGGGDYYAYSITGGPGLGYVSCDMTLS